MAALEAWLLTVVSVPGWRDAVQLVPGPAAWIVLLTVLSLAALNLRRQFAWTRDLLALDLNELRHHYRDLHGLEPSPAEPDTEQAGDGRLP